MSTFLGELSTAAFVKPGVNQTLRPKLCDQLRVSARIPHKSVWIEYNLRRCQARSNILLHRAFTPENSPAVEGVLLQQHPTMDTAVMLHLFADQGHQDKKGSRYYTFPIAYGWTVDDSQSPWKSAFSKEAPDAPDDSEVATGIMGYKTSSVSITAQSPLLILPDEEIAEAVKNLVIEWMGCIRRIWALLATLNDIPAVITDTRQSKGFVARGRYRTFLDHKTLTLTIPQKSYTKVARNLIALARRRAHMVRGHFRVDWRNPPSKRCPWFLETGMHAWNADNVCTVCRGHRLVIHEHQRGDASIGFVTHDYNVTHEPQPPEGV